MFLRPRSNVLSITLFVNLPSLKTGGGHLNDVSWVNHGLAPLNFRGAMFITCLFAVKCYCLSQLLQITFPSLFDFLCFPAKPDFKVVCVCVFLSMYSRLSACLCGCLPLLALDTTPFVFLTLSVCLYGCLPLLALYTTPFVFLALSACLYGCLPLLALYTTPFVFLALSACLYGCLPLLVLYTTPFVFLTLSVCLSFFFTI